MKINSLVEYIGGQDINGQKLFKLEFNTPYTVNWLGMERIQGKPRECIGFVESGQIAFIIEMFREIQPPMDIDIESLIEKVEDGWT